MKMKFFILFIYLFQVFMTIGFGAQILDYKAIQQVLAIHPHNPSPDYFPYP